MPVINCLIIEDEPLAARVVAEYVLQIPELRLAGICEDVPSALNKLIEEKIDLILLDINLPKINGIEFIKMLPQQCHIIFTTAYREFAIEGFELDVVDYLLKPFTFERFSNAVNKVLEYERLLAKNPDGVVTKSYIFIKSSGRMLKVLFDDILFVESLQNYVVLHLQGKKLLTYSTLRNIEQLLPVNRFIKVQKSFIVSIDKITELQATQLYIGKTAIAISRKLKEEIRQKILYKDATQS